MSSVAMSSQSNIDLMVERFSKPETDLKAKVDAAILLRDSLEHYVTGQIYKTFLEKLIPIFITILKSPPVFVSTSLEQKLRHCVLEILHRLPTNPLDTFEPFAEEVVDLLMNLVRIDNEENASLCVKTIMDIMRHQTKVLQDKVQPFLTLIQELFDQMEAVVRDQLDNPTPNVPSTPGSSQTFQNSPRPGSPVASVSDLGADPQQQTRPLLKGMQSFKVLAECPIIVVSIFQVYRATVGPNVKLFVPLIKNVLVLQAKPQEQAHADAAAKGTIFTGVSPNVRNRAAFGEFITAQVKTMSFLAYLLRAYSQQLTDFLPTLPNIIVRLLKDCPREKSGARKELLVAIRHIINFNFRKIFLTNIDELLDEKTLIGDGLTVYETMRPLAYSMLADLIHHVRDALEPQQIRKTVEVYTKNLQDSFPGTSFQTMSAKLLLNMAECIAKMPNKADARHYLIMILNAIGDKFAAMNRQYPNAVKLSKLYAQQSIDASPDNYLADKDHPPDWDEIDIFTAMPIKTSNPRDRGADPVADNKFLFKNLMNGLKNTFYQLKACNVGTPIDSANAPAHWQEVSYGFTAEEVQVIIKLFREGAYVFRYYEIDKPATESQYTSPVEFLANHYMVSSSKEEKDLLETFATVFHCIDPATFHEVFHEEIPKLYDMIFEHTALLHVPQFFLASEATSPSFAGMLLRFLMDRIDQVGTADVKKSSILLRLFKLAFMAVTLFANQNEQVLLPHVLDIVTKSIELSTTAEEPMNYFLLLRSLFRSIGGGKFEHLYKQILPLLEMLLEVLNNLLLAARKPADRDLYVELCLTVPARLSNLLPHLSYLMRPLVVALRAGSDLVGQGLRTLELCVDNLTADYLDPIMAPVIDELMTALFDHLRPTPYSHFHSHTTMRILGKLGGRNRKFMTGAHALTFQQYSDDLTSFDLRLWGSKKERAFPAEIGIDLAIGKLMEVVKGPAASKSDVYYKQQALHLIKTQLKLRLGTDNLPDDFGRLVRLQAQDLVAMKCEVDLSALENFDKERSIVKKDGQDVMLKKLIKASIFAVSLPEFSAEATTLLMNTCKHLAFLDLGRSLAEMRQKMQYFNVEPGKGRLYINSRVLGDAVVECLSSDVPAVRDAAQLAVQEVYDTAATFFGSETEVCRLQFFTHLSNLSCHNCYEEEWFSKAGGSAGIHFLITKVKMGDAWVHERQIEFVKALMYVIKDMPPDLPAKTRRGAQDTLEILLKRISKNATKADLQAPPPAQNGQQSRPTKLFQLCAFLNLELCHMNRHVREATKKSLEIISKEIGAEIHELLEPSKDRCIQPIYAKPLRALPFGVQIGFIDAITYYMGLKSDFIIFDDHLNRLLMESLALADAPDESLAGKPAEYRTHESIVNLRVACIRMLTTAMGFEDFQKGPTNPTRTKIVSVFFKCLYSDSKQTIEAANVALKQVLVQTSKLPKELLQNGLRPVLANLQDPRRLSTHGLDGLARLLQLLTTYFKVEIGSRLLDHTKVLAEPNILQRISFSLIEQNEQMKIIAAVFNIFHLLPPAAEHFKERLIETVLDLEGKLRRTRYSPFRAPLYKYLNRYPKDIWLMLLGKIEDQKYGRFLAQVLEHPDSGPLREVVVNDVESLIKNCGDMGSENNDNRYAAIINAINIMHSTCHFENEKTREWMNKKEHMAWFKIVGQKLEQHLRTNTLPQNLRLAAEQAGEQLMVIFTKFLQCHPNDVDELFKLVDLITADKLKLSQTLMKHIYDRIISSENTDYCKVVAMRSLEVYAGKAASQKTKTFLLHNLVNPIIAMDVMRTAKHSTSSRGAHRLMDKALIESIHTKVWKVGFGDTNDDLIQPGIDHTRLEVLQLTAMLVKYHHAILQDARKDIIKFGWTYIRLEDVINKHAAYVVIGYFIAHYETPAKIVQQVYFSLLKTNQNEGRTLVTQALELIAPVLPKRCSAAPGDRNPVWAMAPRRILAEESQNVSQMTSIFNFLVKHADLFYESRDKFVNLIVSSLRKISPPSNPSNESKKLVLNLMTLIWQWEQKRVENKNASPVRALSESPNTLKRKLESLNDTSMSSPSPSKPGSSSGADRLEYKIPLVMQQKMIKYLVEFTASLSERFPLPSEKPRDSSALQAPMQSAPPVEMCKKAISLLHGLLQPQYWGESLVDLFPNVTETVLSSERTTAALASELSNDDKTDEKFITNMINTLQIVRIIVNIKSNAWILQNMTNLQRILEKSLKCENPEIQDCLHAADEKMDDGRILEPLLKRILDAIPEDVPMEDADAEGEAEASTSELVTFLSGIATEMLSNNNYISGINILWTLAQRKPSEMDQHVPQIMKALQSKLAREHVAHYNAISAQPGLITPMRPGEPEMPGRMQPYDLEIQTGLMLKAIDVISMRMDVLGDNRRPFLSVLATLVEKSLSNTLCLKILDMVETWVFKSEGSWPTLKEKTAVLHKMLNFENRPDQTLLMKFLELVIRIYEDPKITRTEITVRLEHAFLIGTRAQDVDMRNRFMTIFNRSQSKEASARLTYVINSQNWDTLADSYWLAQASQLLLGAVDMNYPLHLHHEDFRTIPASNLFQTYSYDSRSPALPTDAKYDSLLHSHRKFLAEVGDVRVRDVIEPLSQLQHLDPNVAHEIWVALFPMYWAALPKDERSEVERGMVALLTKEFHSRQLDKRPNVVQSLLEGAAKSWPDCKIPPHVLKFEARTYNAWYTALCQLEKAAIKPELDSALVRESNLDALVELYSGLNEDDLFYGTWRRRCSYVETNAALSYEQNGMWIKAQAGYETAQIKARTGALPFSQGEYMLWEDHWVLCATKLQQWEILSEFAKHENFQDLLLECAWKQIDMWSAAENRDTLDNLIRGVMDAPTPRRTFFQAFMSLLKLHNKTESPAEFSKVCDEAIQLSIRKWHQLPKRLTNAHIPLLQNFQQLVELHDASIICQSLAQTNVQNLDVKSGELKLLLGTWRDRLPNVWDDITAWQDLVTWRQHIFGLINTTYLSLIPAQGQNANGTSYAYRGFHETAWIINRFAHVARKHQLRDVCISQLSRIYLLPNIEIQEAFLKLREQAKCHYQNSSELTNGLDVINNTNLNYFGAGQKAEFYTLKGMFLEKLQQKDEAHEAYGMALFFDIKLPKAWAEWGNYNDRLFKENPGDYTSAKNALSCYLEAAGLFKNAKSRKLLTRILWLLSLDDAEGTLSAQFDDFKGETPVWYWITFIPQLLTGLGHKEAPKAHIILAKIAKAYPQSLYFQLRTNREDMLAIKKQQDAKLSEKERRMKARAQAQGGANGATSNPTGSPVVQRQDIPSDALPDSATGSRSATTNSEGNAAVKKEPSDGNGEPAPPPQAAKKFPWEHTEEIMAVLKTAFPLLALSMENMVDQIQKNFKCSPDEDAYRLISALLNDAFSHVGRGPTSYAQDVKLPPSTDANITRFADTVLPAHIRTSFEADFIRCKPTMHEYIQKLRKWRDKFEAKLDRRKTHAYLESYSPHLSEFRFLKYDEVEVPGQYLQHKDKNQDFIRIERFLPTVDLVRSVGVCHRRIRIRGHDGSIHPFAIQHPAARLCRREERILQLFRHFNGILSKRKESRRRNLNFHLPLMVPLAPHIRMVQDDPTYISLQALFDDHCRKSGMSKDEPIVFTMEQMRTLVESKKSHDEILPSKLEIFSAITHKLVPNDIARDYFQAVYPAYSEYWLFRRQFSYQFAALTFMTYILHMHQRNPNKLNIARGTGNIWGSELMCCMAATKPIFHNPETIPFRLTPNLQTLMGPLATEGIFSCAIMAIARCLTEPEYELEQQLSLFVRDEMIHWFTSQYRSVPMVDRQLRETVQANSEVVVKRTLSLASTPVGSSLPANQTVIDLIAKAVNPVNLVQTEILFMPYL
ncbi:FAT domain-containing protein [Drepanopeziza brunnea f. sp. 'multigermtubi' MB_m1]|uniref:FAT domain-containing protein n=2 Tax=Drepanopeziza brunnea f. sp. 'multigermtubi' TaxID=698441 RepID=K1XQ77_MARBU|nr:FAT domain-containing protein [Drepanopeziza brunnea f. sp. 'multigermtubi' MB_m1]EKD14699.1 FAT domain-containing protein [Drepanopeziza brunnea f. sp. 'multigermtubi' MB_m1]